MGINSTEVSYQFGQMGSAHTDLASQLRPPKGMVIVAIQFLGANILTELTAELQDPEAAEFVGTAVAAHDTGDITETCQTSGASTELAIGGACPAIKVGMIIESQGDTDIPYSLTNPTTVVSYNGCDEVIMSATHTVSSQAVGFFSQRGSGFGGIAMSGINFPASSTIYGRWTSVTPAADPDGGIICYFGI